MVQVIAAYKGNKDFLFEQDLRSIARAHHGEFIGSDVGEGICELEFLFKDGFLIEDYDFQEALPMAERFCFITEFFPNADATIEAVDVL